MSQELWEARRTGPQFSSSEGRWRDILPQEKSQLDERTAVEELGEECAR